MEYGGVRFEVEGGALPCLYAFTTWFVRISFIKSPEALKRKDKQKKKGNC